jgi:hypothetical protein
MENNSRAKASSLITEAGFAGVEPTTNYQLPTTNYQLPDPKATALPIELTVCKISYLEPQVA